MNSGCATNRLLGLIATGIVGCDVGFVETQPPNLRMVSASFTAEAAAEPIVFGLVLDLELPDSDACSGALDWIEGVAASALPQVPAVALPEQRISGDACQVLQGQTFDPQPMMARIHDAKVQFPSAHLRPVVLFVTNLELSLQPGVVQGLSQLAAMAEQPEIWTIAPQVAASSFRFDRSIAWSFTQDPTLLPALTALAATVLPFQSAPAQSRRVFLAQSDVAGMTLMKLCQISRVSGAVTFSTSPAFDASKAASIAGTVPAFDFTTAATFSVPKSSFVVPSITVTLEGCAHDCHHLVDGNEDGPGTPWDTTNKCSSGKVTQ